MSALPPERGQSRHLIAAASVLHCWSAASIQLRRPTAAKKDKKRLQMVAILQLDAHTRGRALTQAGVGKDEADIYAESLRRGGAVVSARVADADASRLQAVLDSSAIQVADRGAFYRKSGWKTFDPAATPYTADQVKKERSLYM
jgi:hypothetical protein